MGIIDRPKDGDSMAGGIVERQVRSDNSSVVAEYSEVGCGAIAAPSLVQLGRAARHRRLEIATIFAACCWTRLRRTGRWELRLAAAVFLSAASPDSGFVAVAGQAGQFQTSQIKSIISKHAKVMEILVETDGDFSVAKQI